MSLSVLFIVGLVILVLAVIGGMFPLWKSATLSSASIKRRTYWTGCSAGIALMSVSQIPQWRSVTMIALAFTFGVVLIAFGNTSHIKVDGKIYAAYGSLRQPDPPPSLRRSP